MRLCIVPMKPLARAKERLGPALTPEQRRDLSLAMLTDVTTACVAAADVVWVICSDEDAAETARAAGAKAVPDPTPDDGLNASIAAVTASAVEARATGTAIVAADVPAIRAEDVAALCLGEGIAIAPNRTGTGTNGLWRSPPDLIPVFYGPGSRTAHQGLAFSRGIPCAIVPLERMALDVDLPRDLDMVAALGPGPATASALGALGYPRSRR